MKNKLATAVVCALLAGLVVTPTAEAGRKAKKITRSESHPYQGIGGFEAQGSSGTLCIQDMNCIPLVALSGEKYLALQVVDTTGTDAPFVVDIDGSSTTYCGQSENIWLNGATDVALTVLAVSASCTGVGSMGTINATFSNLP